MRKLTADLVYTGNLEAETVIIVDRDGCVKAIEPLSEHDPISVETFSGILIPGYVNAHCHLELSHMQGKISSGTGLIRFIKEIVSQREVDQHLIEASIKDADEEMVSNGIVAVGDICNKVDTFACKGTSSIWYHSFVEMFDFMQPRLAKEVFNQYMQVYEQAEVRDGHTRSAVPHAPYSVSKDLFGAINAVNGTPTSISLHNQETRAETELFRDKSGGFEALFASFGFPYGDELSTGQTSLAYALSHLDARHKVLLVHNTESTNADVQYAHEWGDQIYWVSCPNANLYIENRLPNYTEFLNADAKVCLGTDSYASNWQLSIFEEMKTVKKYNSSISTRTLIDWATLHGAQSLGIDDRFGSIAIGKTPGLNVITVNDRGEIDARSTSTKLM